jgi:hypothetical protein
LSLEPFGINLPLDFLSLGPLAAEPDPKVPDGGFRFSADHDAAPEIFFLFLCI